MYILTGCSGVGKTSTGMALQKLTREFVVLDADMFYNIMPHETEQDSLDQIEQMQSLSKNISQSGKSVVWTKAGNIDMLKCTYSARFFTDMKVLALTCSETELRRRMTEGRGITDEGWLKSSADYNEYFKTHTALGDVAFETMDISDATPEESAESLSAKILSENTFALNKAGEITLGELVRRYGDFQSEKVFSLDDYKGYLLNCYVESLGQ